MINPSKRVVTRKGLQTQERVIVAGIECIAELGFHAASTNKIASRAGVTWGTLQHQFGDKITLLQAILEYAFNEQIEALRQTTDASLPLRDRISNMVDAFWFSQSSPASIALGEIVRSVMSDPEYRDRFLPTLSHLRNSYDEFWLQLFSDLNLPPEYFEATKQLAIAAIRGLALESQQRSSDKHIISAKKLLSLTLYQLMISPPDPDAEPISVRSGSVQPGSVQPNNVETLYVTTHTRE